MGWGGEKVSNAADNVAARAEKFRVGERGVAEAAAAGRTKAPGQVVQAPLRAGAASQTEPGRRRERAHPPSVSSLQRRRVRARQTFALSPPLPRTAVNHSRSLRSSSSFRSFSRVPNPGLHNGKCCLRKPFPASATTGGREVLIFRACSSIASSDSPCSL